MHYPLDRYELELQLKQHFVVVTTAPTHPPTLIQPFPILQEIDIFVKENSLISDESVKVSWMRGKLYKFSFLKLIHCYLFFRTWIFDLRQNLSQVCIVLYFDFYQMWWTEGTGNISLKKQLYLPVVGETNYKLRFERALARQISKFSFFSRQKNMSGRVPS